MSDVKSTLSCPICGTKQFSRTFEVTRIDRYAQVLPEDKRVNAKYRECSYCLAMYLENGNFDEEAYASGQYYSVDFQDSDALENRYNFVRSLPQGKSDNLDRVARIKSFAKSVEVSENRKKSVLDIGAGMGVFLDRFVDHEWSGTAVEPDANLCGHIRKVLPEVKVIEGYVETAINDQKFDLITLNRVLEHIPSPTHIIQSLKKLLTADGFLYIELPDVLSFYVDGPNNEAFGYGHYVVYSPLAMTILAKQAGFEILAMNRVVDPSTKFTLYAFLDVEESRKTPKMPNMKLWRK
jgi:SAM-dependent methyltransferase